MSSAIDLLTPPIHLSIGNATPIHSLPTELLLAVFTFVDEDEEYQGQSEDALSLKHKHWQLGRVCHWWRIVVEGSPSLWTRLDVHLAKAAMLRDPTALLHHVLRLTKGQGLTLCLDFEMSVCDDKEDNRTAPALTAMDLFDILAAHAPCWRHVVFTHSIDMAYVLSKTVGDTTLAKLESLFIVEDSAEDSDDEDEDGDDSDDEDEWEPNAPLLERVFVSHTSLVCGDLHPQLKEFIILNVTYDISLAHLLHTSSCLEVLWAEDFASEDDSECPLPIKGPARVTSSSLLHLALHENVEDLDTVDLPNLCSLIAGDPVAESAAPYFQPIFDLVQFSRPPLTKLALLNCDFESGNLVDVLKLLPLLKMFRIHFGNIELDDEFNGNVDRALSSLTCALGEVDKETRAFILVPDLEDFRIDFLDGTEVASAFKWTFYTPKVEVDFGMRQRLNGFMASCTFRGEPYFGVPLPGSCEGWNYALLRPECHFMYAPFFSLDM